MGFLKIFSGKGPEEYEHRGDEFFELKEYGAAKLEYETALDKMRKKAPDDTDLGNRLREKILKSRERLALQHKHNGELLRESGDYEGAMELFNLARELTDDSELKAEIGNLLNGKQSHIPQEDVEVLQSDPQEQEIEIQEWHVEEDEYFTALCGALPDEAQDAYRGYGEAFIKGYVALNSGDYELALTKLSQAMEENHPDSLIPLELATAYLNLKRYDDAVALLELFVTKHPDYIPGYQIFCEALWAINRFDEADDLLLSCPQAIVESTPVLHLRGESLYRSGRYEDAEVFYRKLLESLNWDELTALSLAATYEALGKKQEALALYSEIMSQCQSCRMRINPFVKQKYADISMELGDHSAQILEIYLSLVDEDPAGRENHFRKVEQIYIAKGNEREARRYRAFADSLNKPPTG
ncbi:MAG TPA: tetratricopeptide repeat protein [Syntrophales bacterium]|nr:tetratricopeptide repeat protein [Syntrophales bacterium]